MAGRVEESDGATALVEMASEALWPVATWNWVGVLFYGAVVAWMWGRGGMRYLLPAVVVWIVGEFLWTTDHHAGLLLLLTVVAGVWLACGFGAASGSLGGAGGGLGDGAGAGGAGGLGGGGGVAGLGGDL